MIIINFKAFDEGIGENAVKLAKICNSVSKKHKIKIAIAVQQTDIYRVVKEVSIPVFAQHVNKTETGANTGWISPTAIKQAGAIGTILNHSEHRIPFKQIKNTIKLLKKESLMSIVCAQTSSEVKQIAKLKPDYIAVEPKELIGTKTSISKAKPKLIVDSVKSAGKIKLLCGAGIHTKDDVNKATQLGAIGVLVASGVVKAKNQRKALEELVNGVKRNL